MGPQPLSAALRVIVANVSVDGPDLATTFIKNDLGRSYDADKKRVGMTTNLASAESPLMQNPASAGLSFGAIVVQL